jgi:hypothetical protein
MNHMRHIGKIFIVSLLVLHGTMGHILASESTVPFRWENWDEKDRSFLEEQRSTLKEAGAKVENVEEAVPSVKNPAAVWLILAGAAAVAVLTETIINAVKVSSQCGLVVDGSGKTVAIRQNCDLAPGEILAVGGVQVEKINAVEKPSFAVSIVTAIIEGVLSKGPR